MEKIEATYQKLNLGTFVITEVFEQVYSAYAGTLPLKIDKEINKLLKILHDYDNKCNKYKNLDLVNIEFYRKEFYKKEDVEKLNQRK